MSRQQQIGDSSSAGVRQAAACVSIVLVGEIRALLGAQAQLSQEEQNTS
jgi:hypothetical protein